MREEKGSVNGACIVYIRIYLTASTCYELWNPSVRKAYKTILTPVRLTDLHCGGDGGWGVGLSQAISPSYLLGGRFVALGAGTLISHSVLWHDCLKMCPMSLEKLLPPPPKIHRQSTACCAKLISPWHGCHLG